MKTIRRANDAYYTEPALAAAICDTLQSLLGSGIWTILEPSAGAGAFCKAARAQWPSAYITAVEPFPPHAISTCDVFYRRAFEDSAAVDQRFDLVVGNPPYGQAEKHVQLARSIGTYTAFLLRLSFLGSQGRAKRVFAQPGLRFLLPIAVRPRFILGKGADNSEYACFVWQQGFKGHAEILPHLWCGA